jgi:NADH-ubiquinone oxidoreductase chain 6
MTLAIILLSVSIFTSIILVIALNPITIGISILTIALTLAIIYGLTLSSWIAFLLFLIYIGGILVMFAYFVALSPNQQINKLSITPSLIFIISIFTVILYIQVYPRITPTFQFLINTFYTNINISLLILLAIILFLTIVVVVKIVTNNKGPLRPFIRYV